MFRRVLLVVVLCVSLGVLLEVEAGARCRLLGGSMVCSDPTAYTYLAGLGNVTKNPTNVTVTIIETMGEASCWNKGDNSSSGQGIPFTPHDISLISTVPVPSELVTKNGTAAVAVTFTWDDLNAPLLAYVVDNQIITCPNDNWYVNAYLTQFFAHHLVQQYDITGAITFTAELCRKCDFMSADTELGECGFNCNDVGIEDCTNLMPQ